MKMIPMKFVKLLSHGALALVAFQAFAQSGPYADPGAGSHFGGAPVAASTASPAQQGPGVRTLTWDEFRQSCDDPTRFQSQRPPDRITISCSNDVVTWVPAGQASVGLTEARTIRGSLVSDKYVVQSEEHNLPNVVRAASCPTFKEVHRWFNYDQLVECEDLRKFTGTLRDFCVATLDNAVAANPGVVNEKATGNTLDLCEAGVSSPKQF
jgi:hypothetical protein